MSYTIIFKEEADIDVFEAREWYEPRRKGLGDELLEEIEENIRVLEEEPQFTRYGNIIGDTVL